MIVSYHVAKEKQSLSKKLYGEQKLIYKKLKTLERSASLSQLDLLRVKNKLTTLERKLLSQKNEILIFFTYENANLNKGDKLASLVDERRSQKFSHCDRCQSLHYSSALLLYKT